MNKIGYSLGKEKLSLSLSITKKCWGTIKSAFSKLSHLRLGKNHVGVTENGILAFQEHFLFLLLISHIDRHLMLLVRLGS